MTLYLLDTNIISEIIANEPRVIRHASERLIADDKLGLCRPVHYEILRGLIWRNAGVKLGTYIQRVVPIMTWQDLIDSDWETAAQLWAGARRQGKQLGDPDLFLAALTLRMSAILVSADADFDALAVQRENWHS